MLFVFFSNFISKLDFSLWIQRLFSNFKIKSLINSFCDIILFMITKKEQNYMKFLLSSWIVLMIITFVSAVLCLIEIWQNETMTNNIFELLFMAIHLIVLGFFIMVTYTSLKSGSHIIRGLAYSSHDGVNIPLRIASIIIFLLGVALLVMGILYLTPSGVYDFKFPITLKWDMINSGLLLMVLMGNLFSFPFIFALNPSLSKKEEKERK